MKTSLPKLTATLTLILGSLTQSPAWALKPGDLAPNFTGIDSNGKAESLVQYRGKYVVLEWANKGCPYERKHYNSGNMEKLQREWTGKGVVWLSVLSSAPGKEGYVTPTEENTYLREMHAAPTAAILDPSGQIGRLYNAKTTPHMFVIDPQGKIVYEGAIDDAPSTDPSTVNAAHNYVTQALNESMAGKPVATPVTRPYGCSVKYAE